VKATASRTTAWRTGALSARSFPAKCWPPPDAQPTIDFAWLRAPRADASAEPGSSHPTRDCSRAGPTLLTGHRRPSAASTQSRSGGACIRGRGARFDALMKRYMACWTGRMESGHARSRHPVHPADSSRTKERRARTSMPVVADALQEEVAFRSTTTNHDQSMPRARAPGETHVRRADER
jgi:hypothetical protein